MWCFTRAFRIVNRLRIQAVSATFAGFPAARRCAYNFLRTGC